MICAQNRKLFAARKAFQILNKVTLGSRKTSTASNVTHQLSGFHYSNVINKILSTGQRVYINFVSLNDRLVGNDRLVVSYSWHVRAAVLSLPLAMSKTLTVRYGIMSERGGF